MTVQITDITEGPVFALGPDPNRTVYPTGVAAAGAVGTAQVNAAVAVSGVAGAVSVGTAQLDASVVASGVASAGAAGTPTIQIQTNTLEPVGIASTAAFGTAKTVVQVTATGAASTGSVGSATAFTSLAPTGIAGFTTPGSPRLSFVMNPSGIGSGVAFGDADTVATVFVIPGPVDPSNEFGTVNITRKGFLFRTPRTTYQWRIPPYKEYEGISLLREDGVWSEVQHPDLPRTLAAQIYLAGGRDHFVTETTRDELVALGYTVTEEIIP